MGLETQHSVHNNDTVCLRIYLGDIQFEAGNLTLYVNVILVYHRFLSLWSLNLSEFV